MRYVIGFLLGICSMSSVIQSKGLANHKVKCSEDWMQVYINLPARTEESPLQVYLEGMKGYPNPKCQPQIEDNIAGFQLSLKDFYECGVTRVVNKITGKKVFHHKITIEQKYNKEFINVKCIIMATSIYNISRHSHSIVKRDVLPPGFEEPIDLDITTITERAPEPVLSVAVRQGNQIVTGELNVSPGTPLSMDIYLDKASAPIYGLGVTYMQVTDTNTQEETIIFNGCSVDPYLFNNFNTVDGDFLTAKFRAFKFPETTYVQFRGTVSVCVNKCEGVPCSDGKIGYGRKRKRSIMTMPNVNQNRVFEISMTTFIKVKTDENSDPSEVLELQEKLKQLTIVNKKLERNSRGSVFRSLSTTNDDHEKYTNDATAAADENSHHNAMSDDSTTIIEETAFIRLQQNNNNDDSSSLLSSSPSNMTLVNIKSTWSASPLTNSAVADSFNKFSMVYLVLLLKLIFY